MVKLAVPQTKPAEINSSEISSDFIPLGFFSFGLTAILLGLSYTGLIPVSGIVLAMGIFYGGVGQVVIGFIERQRGNLFGSVVFVAFGLFWLSLLGMVLLPKCGFGEHPQAETLASYLFLWGMFSVLLMVSSVKLCRALRIFFASLVLFFALWSSSLMAGTANFSLITGGASVCVGGVALYTGLALRLRELCGRPILPLG